MSTITRCDRCGKDATHRIRLEVEGAMSRVFAWDFCSYRCLTNHIDEHRDEDEEARAAIPHGS